MSEWEILRRIELAAGGPTLAGIRTASLFVGQHDDDRRPGRLRGSLGDVIADESSYRFSGVLGAAICVAVWRSRWTAVWRPCRGS